MKRERYWLNKTNMAASLGISPQAFSAWGVEPVARIGREAFYTVADVLNNRETHYSAQGGVGEDSNAEDRKIAYQLARIRLTNEQADAQHIKNEIARKHIAPFDFVAFVLSKLATEISGIMDALPLELIRQLGLPVEAKGKIEYVTAVSSNRIADLADKKWLGQKLDEFNRLNGGE